LKLTFIDVGWVDLRDTLREISDARWLEELSPKNPEEILRLSNFRDV